MSIFSIIHVLFFLGLVGAGLVALLSYNNLIAKKNQIRNSFAALDALLKKRYDLIPNLVSTVQNYMKHERAVLTEITELRAKATSGQLSNAQRADIENKLSKVLSGIMIAVENYPDLKANQNFLQLQAALNEVEEQISAGRRFYNASVTAYNNALEMFPSSVIASAMNLVQEEWMEIEESQRRNVNIGRMFKK